jgi:hypothetical protein
MMRSRARGLERENREEEQRGRIERENERKSSKGERRGRTAAGWLLLTLLTDWLAGD